MARLLTTLHLLLSCLLVETTTTTTTFHHALNKQVPPHRKLDGEEEQDPDEYYQFLAKYDQVYVGCDANKQTTNVNGWPETGAVLFRLCPSTDNDADVCTEGDSSSSGQAAETQAVCSQGYADYVISIETYLELFLNQLVEAEEGGDDDDDDDDNDIANFGQCAQLQVEGGDENVLYYTGPMCNDDGDIKIALFVVQNQQDDGNNNNNNDSPCIPENESKDVTYADLMGVDLPWDKILERNVCEPYTCYGGENDDGEVESIEFCQQLFAQAALVCEQEMTYAPGNGKYVSDCEEIDELHLQIEKNSKGGGGNGSSAGWFISAILLVGIVGAAVCYMLRHKKREEKAEATAAADALL